jgi:hypothetical protein
MAKPLVPDELWMLIEALLPPERLRPKGDWPLYRHLRAIG